MFMQAHDEDTGEQMTDGQLRDEVVTMLLAGHENTATALAWLWALLDQHSPVAAQLHAELDQVLGGRAPAAADYPALPFTRAVVEETMRLHPPAYMVNRRVAADDVVCGFKVRRGGAIVLSPLILHRHPDYWERPDDFVPARCADLAAEERRPKFVAVLRPPTPDRYPTNVLNAWIVVVFPIKSHVSMSSGAEIRSQRSRRSPMIEVEHSAESLASLDPGVRVR